MLLLPKVHELRQAADDVDAVAVRVDVDAASVARLVEELPWSGPRREAVRATTAVAVGIARGQADAERELAAALRRLAGEVERELRVLAELAARARGHLEELLRRARALADAAAAAVAEAAARVATRVVAEILSFDPVGALREARAVAQQAADRLGVITARLATLPEPHDPQWRRLGPEILGWRPL